MVDLRCPFCYNTCKAAGVDQAAAPVGTRGGDAKRPCRADPPFETRGGAYRGETATQMEEGT